MILAATTKTSSDSDLLPLLIIIVLFGVFYYAIIRPQRNRQRQAQQTQRAVIPGQRVRTTAGIYGTVVTGDERDVEVEIAPGVRVRMLRRAIMDVIPEDDPSTAGFDGSGQPSADGAQPSADGAVPTASASQSDDKAGDDRGDLTI
jgi:preprotein translocase subunit YajC